MPFTSIVGSLPGVIGLPPLKFVSEVGEFQAASTVQVGTWIAFLHRKFCSRSEWTALDNQKRKRKSSRAFNVYNFNKKNGWDERKIQHNLGVTPTHGHGSKYQIILASPLRKIKSIFNNICIQTVLFAVRPHPFQTPTARHNMNKLQKSCIKMGDDFWDSRQQTKSDTNSRGW